jgi:hypothetical protein
MANYTVQAPITRERMQYVTDLMQVNIPTPDVGIWAPIVIVDIPPFQNELRAMFMVQRSDNADYNLLTGSVLRPDGRAVEGSPIDCSDMEDFDLRSLNFEIGDDQYTIEFQVSG